VPPEHVGQDDDARSVSHAFAAAMISLRRMSMSSSGPMEIARHFETSNDVLCGGDELPANRPCVTTDQTDSWKNSRLSSPW